MNHDRLGVLLLSGVRHQADYVSLLANHPRLRVVALADEPDLPTWMDEANAALAAQTGVPYVRDVAAALGRKDVHVVSVCPEPTRHARLAAQAAAAGKHVVVDKPMALSQRECDELQTAVRRGGGTFTYVHRLFSPAVQRLRGLIDAGRIGLPWAVNIVWLAAGGLGGVTVENDALVADARLSGGGELANFLGYPVGYLRYLTGLEVETVYATTATHSYQPHRDFGVEDFGVVMLGLERGVMSTITVGRLPAGSAPGVGIYSLRVHGSHGSVLIDEDRPELRVFQPLPDGTGVRARYGSGSAGAIALRGLLDDFVDAIDTGRAPLCGIEDGRALVAVLEATYASAASGQVVTLSQAAAEFRP